MSALVVEHLRMGSGNRLGRDSSLFPRSMQFGCCAVIDINQFTARFGADSSRSMDRPLSAPRASIFHAVTNHYQVTDREHHV